MMSVSLKLVYIASIASRSAAFVAPWQKQMASSSPVRQQLSSSSLSSALFDTKQQELYTPPPNSLVGKTIVITGATSGLGLESACRLSTAGADLVLTARTAQKGEAALAAVTSYLTERGVVDTMHPDRRLSYKIVDFDNLSTVKNKKEWDDVPKIDGLLLNAGIMAPPEREITVDGFEKQMQSNHLGHFALAGILNDKFADDCRIVSVSSVAHTMAATKGMTFDYKAEQGYSAWPVYGQSKLANILFTKELQRRATEAGRGWVAATLHPGVVATDLGRYIMGEENYDKFKQGNGGFLQTIFMKAVTAVLKTPQQGATTQIWLVSGADGQDVRGKYYADCKARVLDPFATDVEAASQLWADSERLTGVQFSVEKSAVTV